MRKRIPIVVAVVFFAFLFACFVACAPGSSDVQPEQWQYDESGHWKKSNIKGNDGITEKQPHVYTDDVTKKICSICGKTSAYTDRENMQYWIDGRDFALQYTGAYTSTYSLSEESDDGTKTENKGVETYNGNNKFANCDKLSEQDDNGIETVDTEKVFEPAKIGDVDCLKFFERKVVDSDFDNQDVGAYYAQLDQTEDCFSYKPEYMLKNEFPVDGNTVEEIGKSIADSLTTDGTVVFNKFLFVRNGDGSVSLLVELKLDEKTADNESSSQSFSMIASYEYKVSDGKLIAIYYSDETIETYKDGSVEKGIFADSYEFLYEFNQQLFDSVDTTTDTVVNRYHVSVNIYIDGYSVSKFQFSSLLGETISRQSLMEEVTSVAGFWTGGVLENVELALYFDEGKQMPVTDEIVLSKEYYDLYLTVTPKTGYAVVFTSFEQLNQREERYVYPKIAYLVEVGKRFFPKGIFTQTKVDESGSKYQYTTYQLLTIDGNAIGEYSSFICEESRIYQVVYDGHSGTMVKIEHDKAVPEWSSNVHGHWHYCDACGLENIDWGVHICEDGKNVCKICGYVTDEQQSEEN